MLSIVLNYSYGGNYDKIHTKDNWYGKEITNNNFFTDEKFIKEKNLLASNFYLKNIIDEKNKGKKRERILKKRNKKIKHYLDLIKDDLKNNDYKQGWSKKKYLLYGYILTEINKEVKEDIKNIGYVKKFKKLEKIKNKGRKNAEELNFNINMEYDYSKEQEENMKKNLPKYISEVLYELKALGVLDKNDIEKFKGEEILIKGGNRSNPVARVRPYKQEFIFYMPDFEKNKIKVSIDDYRKGFKSIIYHELGHYVDYVKLRNDKEFENICWKSKEKTKNRCDREAFILQESVFGFFGGEASDYYSKENKLEDFSVTFGHTFNMLPKSYKMGHTQLLRSIKNDSNEIVKEKIEYMLTLSDYSL